MPKAIIKLHDAATGKEYYLEWSTVVDAPVTYGMSLDEFKGYYREEYGNDGMKHLDERLARVEASRCSSHLYSLADLIDMNRAGPDEANATLGQIIEHYCRNPPADE